VQQFSRPTAGILFVHNLGVEPRSPPACAISGGTAGEGTLARTNVLPSPSTAVGLHFLGARAWLPQVVLTAIHSVGLAAIPMGLLLTGATFYDQVRHLRWENSITDSTGACLLRLGVLPLCMLALARWLPAPIELRQVVVVQAAMPCAVIPVLLAKHYGGEPALALRIILTTSVLAMLTIPLWIQVGLRWIG
jgi:predicted permease